MTLILPVFWEGRKGTPEHYSIDGRKNIYQTETMSKALGSYGGFIAGNMELTDSIREGSKTYQASPLSPSCCCCRNSLLDIIEKKSRTAHPTS
ncbi:MAG: aminotransferase class I/II-fold pyridoxal phosphate-dependent enzyme [Bacteroidales bacterium]|nr:aminotransferase class I/II-fold pyridoxal phosphate-dependent enzyme [Bacteroidales bacterium]